MTRTHNINGVEVPFTQEEEAARDAEEAQAATDQPMFDWLQAMALTDDIPRALEDLYDAMSPATQAKVATKTRDKIIAKKALRGTKP